MKKCVSVLILIAVLGLVVPSVSVLSEVPGLYTGNYGCRKIIITLHSILICQVTPILKLGDRLFQE